MSSLHKVILLFVVLLHMTLQPVSAQDATPQPSDSPPAPGQLVDVGGYELHLYCIGTGSPTIILEPGFGRFSLNWRAFQEQAATITRVCAYDHAGFGWSAPGPAPRDSQHIANELYTLLQNSGETGPYLLVAHSYGGFPIRLFANDHPDLVAGIVLVDATPPDFFRDVEAVQTGSGLQATLEMALNIARAGQWSPQALAAFDGLMNDVSAESQPDYLALATRPTHIEALLAEWTLRLESAAQAGEVSSFGEIPLVTLVAGDRLTDGAERSDQWNSAQVGQSLLSSDNVLIIAAGSSHNIYVDRPDIVLKAIEWILWQQADGS